MLKMRNSYHINIHFGTQLTQNARVIQWQILQDVEYANMANQSNKFIEQVRSSNSSDWKAH